jgi:hypothetical protein
MAEIHNKISTKGAVDAWARITIERFKKELTKKNIRKSGALERSFTRELDLAGGDVQAVTIKFLMYGRFRDMGVGSGVSANERFTNKQNLIAGKSYGSDLDYARRQPKRWFNKPKMAQIYRLREILASHLQTQVTNVVSTSLNETTDYTVRL